MLFKSLTFSTTAAFRSFGTAMARMSRQAKANMEAKTSSSKPPPPPPPPPPSSSHEPGDGVRSIATTNVFRALNFELYAKPNRYMITFGLLAISCCLAFIYNMKLEAEKKLTYGETYMAMDDEDQLVSRQKRSKWD